MFTTRLNVYWQWERKATKLLSEYLTPMCSPLLLQGDKPLASLHDLKHHSLLHDNSRSVWKNWLKSFGIKGVNVNKGPMFSHSMLVLQAASLGQGVCFGLNGAFFEQ